MNKKQIKAIAQSIVKIENSNPNDNNISEKVKEIGELVKYCSIEDLLEIDEIVMNELLKENH